MTARRAVGAIGALVLASALTACGSGSPGGSGAAATAPPPPAPPRVTVSASTPLSPTAPVTVAVDAGRLVSVVMTSDAGKKITGAPAPDGEHWTTTEPLAYRTRYTVVADAVSPQGVPGHQRSTVTTVAPAETDELSVVPGAADAGVGQPISVRFSHPPSDRAAVEKALSVTATPAQPGAWHWISASQIDYRPQSYWKPGTTVTLASHLYGVDLGGGGWGGEDESRSIHIHDAWVAKADGGSERMQIFDNGALVKTMNISLGSPKFPTHSGPHVISDKRPSIVMDSATYGVMPGQPGYYRETVALDERISNDGEFVHAAPWSVGQQGNDNVSHGCVNLAPADAQWFFDHFGVGDVVEVTNSGGPPLPIYDTWGDWELPWSQWQAS